MTTTIDTGDLCFYETPEEQLVTARFENGSLSFATYPIVATETADHWRGDDFTMVDHHLVPISSITRDTDFVVVPMGQDEYYDACHRAGEKFDRWMAEHTRVRSVIPFHIYENEDLVNAESERGWIVPELLSVIHELAQPEVSAV